MLTVGAALAAVTVVATWLSLAVGSRPIGLSEVLGAVLGTVDSDNATVVTSQRVPRTLLGVGVGAALGVAGALMQGHTRNPLADPGLFGVNAGASFAVAALAFGIGVSSPAAVVAAALLGAGLASTTVFLLGMGQRGGGLVMVAILGTTMAALLSALTLALVLLDRQTLDVMRFWQVGSLVGRDFSLTGLVIPLGLIGLALALLNARSLDALSLGEDVAQSLGHDVRRARAVGILAITLLAGTSTAMCGPIVFVGLVAPHAARVLTGHDYRWLVPFSALVGAAILLLADTVGRVAAPPGELQAGLVVAAFGAPVLLAICRRRRLVAL